MSSLNVNTINEYTSANGVTIDGALIKDNFLAAAAGGGLVKLGTHTFDNSGDQPVLLINGEPADHPVYHDTPEFNIDGKDHFIMESDGSGGTNIRIEDLPNLEEENNDDMEAVD